jgi:hypothetical protein
MARDWNFEEILRRLEMIKGMGSLEDLLEQVPDLGALLRDMEFSFDDLKPIESILRAMSEEERLNPSLLEGDAGRPRRTRIADSAETTMEAVDGLIWQFNNLLEMLEKMTPDEVTQELISESKPHQDGWQVSPDAWKTGTHGEDEGPFELAAHDFESDEDGEDEQANADQEVASLQEQLEIRLDDILRKIGREGMSALTPDERAFLEASSQRLQQKR